jgi:hypothetical protein
MQRLTSFQRYKSLECLFPAVDAGGVLRYPEAQQVQDALSRAHGRPVGLLGLATHKAVPGKEGSVLLMS